MWHSEPKCIHAVLQISGKHGGLLLRGVEATYKAIKCCLSRVVELLLHIIEFYELRREFKELVLEGLSRCSAETERVCQFIEFFFP